MKKSRDTLPYGEKKRVAWRHTLVLQIVFQALTSVDSPQSWSQERLKEIRMGGGNIDADSAAILPYPPVLAFQRII
jgi:hypothetical protein